jgi:hypothetical protein
MLQWFSDVSQRMREAARRSKSALVDDWHGARYAPFALMLLVITSLATASFYVGQPPQAEFSYDTASYLHVTQQIQSTGNPVDPLRTPGYPLLMALIFAITGINNNYAAVSIVQGMLFVLATLEIYVLALLLFRRTWVAFLVGLLVGTNTFLISFVKPIIVEGFALWLTVTLALFVVLFVKSLKPVYIWLAAGFMLLLFLTRPEWVYLPIPLLAYLLFTAWRRGALRKLVPHSVVAAAILYVVLGLFVAVNATQNGYLGVSYVQRINLVGKVLQYHMEYDASSPAYVQVQQELQAFAAKGGWNPYDLLTLDPNITANQWALGGAYASSVVEAHPVQFLADSILTFFTASNQYRAFDRSDAYGPVATPPFKLEVSLSAYVAQTYRFFPLFALLWIVLLFWPRRARVQSAEAVGAVVLIALYELLLTSVGGYSNYDYARIHVPFDPLLILVIWGTFLVSIPYWSVALAKLRLQRRAIWWVWGVALVVAVLGSIAFALVSSGVPAGFNPHTWLLVRLVVSHPPRLLTVALLAALVTFFAYRAPPTVAPTPVLAEKSAWPG